MRTGDATPGKLIEVETKRGLLILPEVEYIKALNRGKVKQRQETQYKGLCRKCEAKLGCEYKPGHCEGKEWLPVLKGR